MKKIIWLIIPLIILCSCGKKDKVSPMLTGISFEAQISYYNESYSALCDISKDGVLTAKITQPDILKDFILQVSSQGIKAEYLGITYTPTGGNMPFSGVIDSFYSVLKECMNQETVATLSKEEYIVKGDFDQLGYTLYVAPTGLPQKLLLPDERFSVNFYNVTIKT